MHDVSRVHSAYVFRRVVVIILTDVSTVFNFNISGDDSIST
jgi:hypothetical protein